MSSPPFWYTEHPGTHTVLWHFHFRGMTRQWIFFKNIVFFLLTFFQVVFLLHQTFQINLQLDWVSSCCPLLLFTADHDKTKSITELIVWCGKNASVVKCVKSKQQEAPTGLCVPCGGHWRIAWLWGEICVFLHHVGTLAPGLILFRWVRGGSSDHLAPWLWGWWSPSVSRAGHRGGVWYWMNSSCVSCRLDLLTLRLELQWCQGSRVGEDRRLRHSNMSPQLRWPSIGHRSQDLSFQW